MMASSLLVPWERDAIRSRGSLPHDYESESDDDATTISTSLASIFSNQEEVNDPLVDDGEEPWITSIYDRFRHMRAAPVLATIPTEALLYHAQTQPQIPATSYRAAGNRRLGTPPRPPRNAIGDLRTHLARPPTRRANTRETALVEQTQPFRDASEANERRLRGTFHQDLNFNNVRQPFSTPSSDEMDDTEDQPSVYSTTTSMYESDMASVDYDASEEPEMDLLDDLMAPRDELGDTDAENSMMRRMNERSAAMELEALLNSSARRSRFAAVENRLPPRGIAGSIGEVEAWGEGRRAARVNWAALGRRVENLR